MAIKRGKRWQVNFRHENKLHRPTFDNEVEAQTWEALARIARDQGLPLPPYSQASGKPLATLKNFIGDVYDELWGGNKSQRLYRGYAEEVILFYGPDKTMSSFNTAEVDRYLTSCKARGNSDKTINRKIAILSKLLKKACARDLLAKLPVMSRRREGQGRKRFLSLSEEKCTIDTLWKLGEEQASKRVQFMIYTGARDGEVRNLQWSDIEGRRVTLDGKTGHRTLVLPQKAQEALKWCKAEGYQKPFPMSYSAFKEAWDKISIKMGKGDDPQWVPYIMRHTCASRLVQRGVDIRRVRDWMGHSTIVTTMTYAHLAPDDLEKCADVLDAVA